MTLRLASSASTHRTWFYGGGRKFTTFVNELKLEIARNAGLSTRPLGQTRPLSDWRSR
jgi:hypothetical protein